MRYRPNDDAFPPHWFSFFNCVLYWKANYGECGLLVTVALYLLHIQMVNKHETIFQFIRKSIEFTRVIHTEKVKSLMTCKKVVMQFYYDK